jgi:hypothetical protein
MKLGTLQGRHPERRTLEAASACRSPAKDPLESTGSKAGTALRIAQELSSTFFPILKQLSVRTLLHRDPSRERITPLAPP